MWLQERVEEELESGDDKSLREIGRVIAGEVERLFEVKINPGTIKERARRMKIGTNVPKPANVDVAGVKSGNAGNIDPISKVNAKVASGKSEREAVGEVAQETGKKKGSLRVAVYRKKKQAQAATTHSPTNATTPEPHHNDFAMRYAKMAIADLKCIGNHPDKQQALDFVESWITKHR